MRIQKSIFTLALLLASIGNAVSRVGGGRIQSLKSGFEMSVDGPFKTSQLDGDAVRCVGPVGIIRQASSISAGTQYFEVSEFSNEFSDAIALSKQELINRFEKSNWTVENAQTCGLTLRSSQFGIVAYIVTWGDGKGFVIKGTDSMDTDKAIDNALKSLKINSECTLK